MNGSNPYSSAKPDTWTRHAIIAKLAIRIPQRFGAQVREVMDVCRTALQTQRYITQAERTKASKLINDIALVNRHSKPSDKMLHELTLSAADTSALNASLRDALERAAIAEAANKARDLEVKTLKRQNAQIMARLEVLEAAQSSKRRRTSSPRLSESNKGSESLFINDDDDDLFGAGGRSPSPESSPKPASTFEPSTGATPALVHESESESDTEVWPHYRQSKPKPLSPLPFDPTRRPGSPNVWAKGWEAPVPYFDAQGTSDMPPNFGGATSERYAPEFRGWSPRLSPDINWTLGIKPDYLKAPPTPSGPLSPNPSQSVRGSVQDVMTIYRHTSPTGRAPLAISSGIESDDDTERQLQREVLPPHELSPSPPYQPSSVSTLTTLDPIRRPPQSIASTTKPANEGMDEADWRAAVREARLGPSGIGWKRSKVTYGD
ncbi:MAG: hypothetical protein Q9180_003450 [Flavoplaca navasiana]